MVARESPWEIRGLAATGPPEELREKLALFGQFVGSWVIVDHRFLVQGVPSGTQVGEVHFNWILGGRAIQDVWGPRDPKTGEFVPVGSTLRFYDRRLDAWRTTWISPIQTEVRTFIGRPVGNEIVLRERNRPAGLGERWIFSHVRPQSFRWRAERRITPGGRWEVIEEMRIERAEDEG